MPVAKVKPVLTNMQAIPMRVGTMNTDVYSRTVSGKITSSSILKIFIGTFFKTGNFRLFKLFLPYLLQLVSSLPNNYADIGI